MAHAVDMPEEVADVFRRFEEHVNNQEFSFLDDLTMKIEAFAPRVIWDNEARTQQVQDLHFMSGRCSFKL